MKNLFKTIELNITGLCNRKCSFCPHSVGYSKETFLSEEVAYKLNKDLLEINYAGIVTFAGNGEPLLNKNLPKIVSVVSNGLKGTFKLISNGDLLTKELAEELKQSGLTNFKISKYDSNTKDLSFLENVEFVDYRSSPSHEVNRVEVYTSPRELNIPRYCYLPFYKLFLDYNGDVLLCCNDWKKRTIIGNILKDKIQNIWLSEEFNNYRKNIINLKRNFDPCIFCSIEGDIQGEEYFNGFKHTLKQL